MPPLPPVPSVIKIEMIGTVGSHNFAIVLHAGYSGGPPSATDLNAMATAMTGSWGANIGPQCTGDIVLTDCVMTDLTTSTSATGSNPVTIGGSNGGTTVPGNVAVLVNYPSSYRYRGGHPRSYFPPPATAQLSSASTLSGGATVAWQGAVSGFLATIVGLSSGTTTLVTQVAVSYVNKVVNPVPPYRRPIPLVMIIPPGSSTVMSELASQRRRIGRK